MVGKFTLRILLYACIAKEVIISEEAGEDRALACNQCIVYYLMKQG